MEASIFLFWAANDDLAIKDPTFVLTIVILFTPKSGFGLHKELRLLEILFNKKIKKDFFINFNNL
jgi:hypothetical protein